MAPRRGMMRRGPGAPTEKAKNFKGTLRELLKYMGVYKIALLFVLIFAVLILLLPLAVAMVTRSVPLRQMVINP